MTVPSVELRSGATNGVAGSGSRIAGNGSGFSKLSTVMQKVRSLLPANNQAVHLHLLTSQPLSTCEKVLCGQRPEPKAMLQALLRSEHGDEILLAWLGEDCPLGQRVSLSRDVRTARRVLKQLEARAVE